MKKRESLKLIKKYIFLFVGLLINAFGIVLMTKSCLGTSPIASIPYILSKKFPVTLGSFTFITYFIMFIVQLLILGKKIKPRDFVQLPLSIVYSFFIDLCVSLVNGFKPSGYWVMLGSFIIGCAFRSLGVAIQVTADVAMLSSEAFMIVIAKKIKKDFSLVKLVSDAAMVLIAVILSLIFWGKVDGIREGTLLAVIMTAPLAKFFTIILNKLEAAYINKEEGQSYEHKIHSGGLPLIITISSQSGSGGHKIAKILSDELQLPLYDSSELVDLITKKGNFTEGYVSEHLERLYTNKYWEFFTRSYNYTGYSLESYEPLFEKQTQVIEELAAKGSGIIVGFCSEYILRQRENVISIYIHADEETKLQFLKKEYNVDYEGAEDILKSHDRERALYFRHFTGEEWAKSDRFSLTLDSSLLGIEDSAKLLKEVIIKMVK